MVVIAALMMLNSSVLSMMFHVLGKLMKDQNEKLEVPRLGKSDIPTTRANTGIRSSRRTTSDTTSRILVRYNQPTRF